MLGSQTHWPTKTGALHVIPHGTVCLDEHLIRLGARYGNTDVTALVNGNQVSFHALTGEFIGQLTLDPHKRYATLCVA